MSLIWMDGFETYGTGATGRLNMLDGVWAEVPSDNGAGGPTTAFARTGTKSLAVTATNANRRVLGKTVTEVGVGGVFYFFELPATEGGHIICKYLNVSNQELVRVELQTTGALRVVRGSTLLHETAAPVVVASAWQHIEMYAYIDSTIGAVEVRVNGVTVINITSQNTQGNTGGCAQVAFEHGAGGQENFYIDDLFAWDTTGSFNNDFIGDRRVLTLYPNADTAQADYTITGAATGYQSIDETTPNDETDYISFAALADPSDLLVGDFGLENVPAEVAAIYAVQTYIRMRKDDAGDCNVQTSMMSGTDETEGTDRAITEEWTYWMDVFETNPSTGSQWTPAEFNAAQLRLTRTA